MGSPSETSALSADITDFGIEKSKLSVYGLPNKRWRHATSTKDAEKNQDCGNVPQQDQPL